MLEFKARQCIGMRLKRKKSIIASCNEKIMAILLSATQKVKQQRKKRTKKIGLWFWDTQIE